MEIFGILALGFLGGGSGLHAGGLRAKETGEDIPADLQMRSHVQLDWTTPHASRPISAATPSFTSEATATSRGCVLGCPPSETRNQ